MDHGRDAAKMSKFCAHGKHNGQATGAYLESIAGTALRFSPLTVRGTWRGYVRQGFDVKTAYDGVFADATAFNKKVKLLWFSAGTAEERFHVSTVAIHEALNRAGIKSVFYSSAGTAHEWQTWRRSLHEFAPRLFRD